MSLLSDSDLERVERAVQELEKTSATELVVAVFERSGEYWQRRVAVALLWSIGAALGLVELFPELYAAWAVVLQIPVGFLTYALFGVDVLERLLIPKSTAAEAVDRRALETFAARGLYKTRDRTGMLILISELEHRVVILGDTGIHERVGSAGWQAHVDHLTAAIRRGDAVTGLLEVIERLGKLHAEHVPARPDNFNELPNEVVRDRS